jgi:hypothetical protein
VTSTSRLRSSFAHTPVSLAGLHITFKTNSTKEAMGSYNYAGVNPFRDLFAERALQDLCTVMAASLQACGVIVLWATATLICRRIVTIWAGLYLWMGITCVSFR